MNIKIMLNKDAEINELAKDPDVQVKIKAAIVDGIGTRAVKAVQKELASDINEAVRKAVYEDNTFNLKDSVKEDIKKRVEQAVSFAITTKICDIMEKEFYSIVREKAESYVKQIDRMDIKAIVAGMAAKILERKLSR